jgi:hypothetical protein
MHWAVANQHTEIIKILKERGALEDVADEDGFTPSQINSTINSLTNSTAKLPDAKGIVLLLVSVEYCECLF